MFNSALNGGAISATDHTSITIRGNTVLLFVSNEAIQNGGTFYITNSTSIMINQSSLAMFNDNRARENGGILHSINSILLFTGNSTVSLNYNEAMLNGGAICLSDSSVVLFSQFTNVKFYNNRAVYGGVTIAKDYSSIKSTGNSVLSSLSNKAYKGGAVYGTNMGKVTFEGNSTSVMSNKFIGMTMDSGITFMGQSKVTFSNNTADNGGSFLLLTLLSSHLMKVL